MRLPTIPSLRFAGRDEHRADHGSSSPVPLTYPSPPSLFISALRSSVRSDGARAGVICAVLLLAMLLAAPSTLGTASAAGEVIPRADGAAAVAQVAYCENLLVNPGFESLNTGWTLTGVESPPQYTTDRAYQGNWSMRLGIVGTGNVPSISAVQQTLTIPDFAETLSLKLRYWPITGDEPGNDLQYIDIYNGYNNQFIRRVWYDTANMEASDMDGDGDRDEIDIQATEWLFQANDLTDIKASTDRIRIFFAVTNDGASDATALYLDDVELVACDSEQPVNTPTVTSTGTPTRTPTPSRTPTGSVTPTPSGTPSATPSATPSSEATATATYTGSPTGTPTITPTHTATPVPADTATATPVPSATPIPTGCVDVVLNGGFENNDHWIIGQDPYRPRFVSEPGQSGTRSMRLGTPPGGDVPTVVTYSSIRQLVTIPSTAQTAKLTYRIKYRTEQAQDESPSNVSDRQEVILLNPDLSTLAIPTRVLRDRADWADEMLPFLDYIGDTFYLYFNVYNDGNGARTWAYLDDVSLTFCYPDAPAATVTSTPTPMAMPTQPATATPVPTSLGFEIASAAATATASDLAAQAAIVATQAAGTPTTVPSRESVGDDVITGSRAVTPVGQVTPEMEPVPGMRFNNLSGFTVMLLVIGGFLLIAVIILLVARAVGGSGGRRGGP